MSCRFAMIGFGNMGGAVLRGALASGFTKAGDWIVAEPDPLKRAEADRLGVRAMESSREVGRELGSGSVLVLAVKPQSFGGVGTELATIQFGGLVISMMAGLSSDGICSALGGKARVVRVMPNLPASVSEGVTAIARGAGASERDTEAARELMAGVGKTVEIEESLIDAFTALAGSGPAYVFFLAEWMERGGVRCGLPAEVARLAARQTVIGAAQLLKESDVEASELRRRVTSKGGTTEAALRHLAENRVGESIEAAIEAARDRGRELGG